ncbi:MAG: dynamin family protein, partial [Prochloron sp. SP5CPC1]|nr:dynamin family protein [Candidatus Paraprochloron terpiosi SP5CPC1]
MAIAQETGKTSNFDQQLERVAKIRAEAALCLGRMTEILEQGESTGANTSGKLGLERDIAELKLGRKILRKGVFRLLVLGDMKRGKSTFLNVLLGDNLLPTDVNPCTAVLTILRYGIKKQVTVYFKYGKRPEKLDFITFKEKYTIKAEEAKRLEDEDKSAFPDIDYAVVEYPLPLLAKGIEIIDTPGLNDTTSRNKLSLGYINNCHCIIFILRASQPCTLTERRYLENYLKGRNLPIFFLINGWDEVGDSVLAPDDSEEVARAEAQLREVLASHLAPYCIIDGEDLYQGRTFELSAIRALRRQMKNQEDNLEGTGFPEFLAALNQFVNTDRFGAELEQARTIARVATTHLQEAVTRRIPLIKEDVAKIKRRLETVEPEFEKLTEIRNSLQQEIRNIQNLQARAIADSFRSYIVGLGVTFEADFLKYQPELNFFDFLNQGKREAFERAFTVEFQQYIHEKLSAWSITTSKKMDEAFAQLAEIAANYGADYSAVTDKITEKLIGAKVCSQSNKRDRSPGWAKWAMGIVSLASGNMAGVAMAGVGFDWQDILLNTIATIGIGTILLAISGGILAPVVLGVVGLGLGALQVEKRRQKLLQCTKTELLKQLPQVAQEQWQPIYDAVKESFTLYEREVMERIDDDIKSLKAELHNLLSQKKSGQVKVEEELTRLRELESKVLKERDRLESTF